MGEAGSTWLEDREERGGMTSETIPDTKLEIRAKKYSYKWAHYTEEWSGSDIMLATYVDAVKADRERIWNNLYAQPYNDTPVGAERARKVIFEEEE